MSNLIVGVDLGTTNSCISIRGSHPDCYVADNIPGFSVITDRLKRKFTPSVLSYTGNPEKPYDIGYVAKGNIEGKYPPVMFAKRHLGSDKKFQLDDNLFISPEEVSTEILKYLKKMAEAKLNQKIEKSVVTVPAYFTFTQKNLTRKAIKEAGFIVDDERCILQEPVAAALTYTQITDTESLRIMVYDLGGGTFDITILQKEGDLIEVVYPGGDHALGGYEFDKLIADYIINMLQETGYHLDFDLENNIEDKMRYTKLLLEAEQAKIELSHVQEVHLRKPSLFSDHNGESVVLDMKLDRPTFEKMISDKVDYTMELCHQTLKSSNFKIDKIDKIIMVGGSTYIPLISRRLKKEFGKEPQYLEPDLCVAIGASIQASQFGIVVEQDVRVKFDLIPTLTVSDKEIISGKVTLLTGKPVESDYTIEIENQLKAFKESSNIEEEGNFFFEVPLQENCENTIIIKVFDKNGISKADTEIKIIHSTDANVEETTTTEITGTVNLPRAIFIKRESGMTELAPKGAQLPFEKREEFNIVKKGNISLDDELELNIQLFEEDLFLGDVTVTNIPGNISDDDPVFVGIKVTPDFQIIVNAQLPTVKREGKHVFSINIESVQSVDNLVKEFNNLMEDWEQLKMLLSQDELAKIGVRINRYFQRVESCLKGVDKDTTEASKVLSTLNIMIKDLKGKGPLILQPSKEKFEKLCAETRKMISAAEQVDTTASEMAMGRTLDALIEQGKTAHSRRDQQAWKTIYRQVEELYAKAAQIVDHSKPGGELPPDPHQLLLSLAYLLNEMREEANQQQTHPYYARWMKQIVEIQVEIQELGKITDNSALMPKIQQLYSQKIAPLRDEIHGGPVEDKDIFLR
ncbi:MAG: Hsp70 family protein [Candidatus Lokiarchaeota archaeon]|nr:Hsp70 family protein [Candidatus Lokiarchaeota archaeon]